MPEMHISSEIKRTMLLQILHEIDQANDKHGPMLDPIEGLHTLKCEVAELEREMMRVNKDYECYREEILQVAAMGLKLFFQCSHLDQFQKLLGGCKC